MVNDWDLKELFKLAHRAIEALEAIATALQESRGEDGTIEIRILGGK